MRTIRKKNVCHCKPERLWWRHVRNTQRTLKYLTMIWTGKREQHLYQYTGIIFCALIQGSVQFRGSWTGHLAAENLTFDPVVESPSVLYISEHATESIQKCQRQTFFLSRLMIIMSQNVHVHLNLLSSPVCYNDWCLFFFSHVLIFLESVSLLIIKNFHKR